MESYRIQFLCLFSSTQIFLRFNHVQVVHSFYWQSNIPLQKNTRIYLIYFPESSGGGAARNGIYSIDCFFSLKYQSHKIRKNVLEVHVLPRIPLNSTCLTPCQYPAFSCPALESPHISSLSPSWEETQWHNSLTLNVGECGNRIMPSPNCPCPNPQYL